MTFAISVFSFRFGQAQTPVGDYVSHTVSGNHINFTLEGARVRVERMLPVISETVTVN